MLEYLDFLLLLACFLTALTIWLPDLAAHLITERRFKHWLRTRHERDMRAISETLSGILCSVPGSETAKEDTCAICKDDLTQPMQLPCLHIYCNTCIRSALADRTTCPLCWAHVYDRPPGLPMGPPHVVVRRHLYERVLQSCLAVALATATVLLAIGQLHKRLGALGIPLMAVWIVALLLHEGSQHTPRITSAYKVPIMAACIYTAASVAEGVCIWARVLFVCVSLPSLLLLPDPW